MKRRINIPFTPETKDENVPFETRAVLWFGQVSHQDNYADVRIIYTPEHLHVHCNIVDEKIWYDNEKPIMLFANDAVSIMLHTENSEDATRIDSNSYYFAGMFKPEHDERPEYQRAFGGSSGHWRLADNTFKTFAHYRGAGAFNTGEASHGWWIAFKIPFSSIGLDGPPKEGDIWKLAILLHDRDSDQSEIIPNKSWPTAVHQVDPSTWGELHFGMPTYEPPNAVVKETITLKNRVDNIRIRDAMVGGAGTCGDDMSHDLFGEWGIRNYRGVEQFNIQNQGDIADWPCFSKYYITIPLNSLPSPQNRVVLDAKLELRQFGNAGQGWNEPVPDSFIQVFSVEENWDEATITWNTAPIASENYGGTWVKPLPNFNAPWPGVPHQFDVTRAAQEAYAAGKALRLAFYSADGPRHTGKYFYSSEAGTEGRPTLTITLGEPEDVASDVENTDVGVRFETQPLVSQKTWAMAGATPDRHSRTDEEVRGNLRPLWYKPVTPYISQRTQIVAAHDLLYLSTARGLYALDADDGDEKWVFATEMPLGHSPTVDHNTVYVCGTDGYVYALDALTGAEQWRWQAPKGFVTNPVVADRLLFAGCRDGNMYAIHTGGPKKGKQAWKFRTDGPILYSAAYRDGTLYFASMDCHAYALVAVTGKLIWKSAKLPGEGFRSWWPVVIDDYVIFSGSHGYRTAVTPGGNAKITDIDRRDTLGDFVTPHRNVITVGDRGHAPGPWTFGTVTLTTEKIRNYLAEKPYRRTVFVLDRQTGEEIFEKSANGQHLPVAPLLWAGTQSGTRYPPVVGGDGVLYQQSGYMIDTHLKDSIMGGQAVGWHPDHPTHVSIPSYMWCAVDEPLGLAVGGTNVYWNLCCDRQVGSYDTSIPNSLFDEAFAELEELYTDAADISHEHRHRISAARPGNLGKLSAAAHREALYVADELHRHLDLQDEGYAERFYANAWIVFVARSNSGQHMQFLARPFHGTPNTLVAYSTQQHSDFFEKGESVNFVRVPNADNPRTYVVSAASQTSLEAIIPMQPRIVHVHTAFGGHPGAVYSNHGDQNPPVPYKGKVYMHRSNAILCWAPEHATAAAPVMRRPAIPSRATRPAAPKLQGALELKRQLTDEVREILNSGPLQPGYANHGLLGAYVQHHIGDALIDYFHNPAETFVTLLRARPHIAGALQDQLDEYLREEFNNFEKEDFCNHVGWRDRRERHNYLIPDDVAVEYRSGRTEEFFQNKARAVNFEFRTHGGWQNKGIWGRNPYMIYGLQKMVSHFGLDAKRYLRTIREQHLLDRIPSKDVLVENSYAINAWLAGYAGLLKLYDAVPDELAPVELHDQFGILKLIRRDSFRFGSPYSATSQIFNGTSYYGNTLNVASNFVYMTPEVVSDTYRFMQTTVKQTIDEIEEVAPHWFITFAAEGLGENAIVPLWDSYAIFMAKAWVLGDSGPELEKYLARFPTWRSVLH